MWWTEIFESWNSDLDFDKYKTQVQQIWDFFAILTVRKYVDLVQCCTCDVSVLCIFDPVLLCIKLKEKVIYEYKWKDLWASKVTKT